MSVRWEFADAKTLGLALKGPDEIFEDSGERIDGDKLVVTLSYDEVFAIVGTRTELLNLAETLKRLATKRQPPLPDGAEGCPVCGRELTLYEESWVSRTLTWCDGSDDYTGHDTGWHAGDSEYGDSGGHDDYVSCYNGHVFAVPTIEEWG